MRKYVDRKLFLILLGYMAAYHVIYISRRVILKFIENEAYGNMSWWTAALEPILTNFIIVPPLIFFVIVVTQIMIDRNSRWLFIIAAHLPIYLIYTSLITVFSGIYIHFFHDISLDTIIDGLVIRILFGSNLNFLGYVGFVMIIYAYHYIHKTAKIEVQKARLSQQLQHVKMKALKSQLNPHFLFNTLNSISSLIREDAHKAQHMIGNLGDLLREILLVKDENMIPVYKEVIILNKYIDIMQTRFSDHLIVNTTIDQDIEEALIPSMLIQPIMENSFKHGYSYNSTKLKVDLSISKKDNWLVIQIQNNGAPISEENYGVGIGIKNIQERLETLFANNFEFSFSNLQNKEGVLTKIKIPLVLA